MNTLSVDLEIQDGKASATLDGFKKNIEATAAQISKLSGAATFDALDAEINKSITTASKMRSELSQVQGSLSKVAREAGEQITGTRNRLVEIQTAMSRTTDSSVLAKLSKDAQVASAQLDALSAKINNVAVGRGLPAISGTTGAVQNLGGAAKLSAFQMQNLGFQINDSITMLALGASPIRVLASQGGQIVQVFGGVKEAFAAAASGLQKLTALTGISGAGFAVFGGLAVAGYTIVEWSKSVREEAERRLKVEEMIAGAMNRQILLGKQLLDNYEKLEKSQASDRQFGRFLKDGSIDDLQARYDNLKQLQNLGGNTEVRVGNDGKVEAVESEAFKKRQEQMLALKAQIDALLQNKTADADRSFNDRWEAWKKSQENAEKAFRESVEKGKDKVKELKGAWDSAFDSLYQRSAAGNPFALFLQKSADQTEKLKKSLAGLPPELQKVALAMNAAANAKEAFSLRLDNALGANSLRSDADNFRNPLDPQKADKDRARLYARYFGSPVGTDERGNPLYDTAGKNTEAISDYIERQLRLTSDTPADRLNKRLSDQYDLIYNRRDPNFDQGVADRKFNALTQGVNPLELSDRLRDAAASSREREATRMESAESDARKQREESIAVQKQIAENGKRLLELAEKEGLSGVIRIIDDTGGKVETRLGKRATEKDTANYYNR